MVNEVYEGFRLCFYSTCIAFKAFAKNADFQPLSPLTILRGGCLNSSTHVAAHAAE
jgi:hypothetical protein